MARTRHTSQSDVLDELLCFDLYAAGAAASNFSSSGSSMISIYGRTTS